MFGFQFVQNSTRFLHSGDLDDMQAAFLSDDDNLTKEGTQPPGVGKNQKTDQITYLTDLAKSA